MTKINDILRLEYIAGYIFSILIAIYINNLNLFDCLDILFAFIFIGISANTINDYIDITDESEIATRERLNGFKRKEMLSVSIISFACGIMLLLKSMVENILILYLLILYILFMGIYGFTKNKWTIFSLFFISMAIVLPYIIIKLSVKSEIIFGDFLILIALVPSGFIIQGGHEIMDGHAIQKLSLRTQQLIILISIISILSFGYLLWIYYHNIYAIVPSIIGLIIYFIEFKNPTNSSQSMKDGITAVGNVAVFYIFILIILRMNNLLL